MADDMQALPRQVCSMQSRADLALLCRLTWFWQWCTWEARLNIALPCPALSARHVGRRLMCTQGPIV